MGIGQSLNICTRKSEPDDSERPLFEDREGDQVKYGEFFVLCNNKSLPPRGCGPRRNKYILRERDIPNGIRRSTDYMVNSSLKKAASDRTKYSIIYLFSNDQAAVVEYTSDENTDLFQFGRFTGPPIDFAVKNVVTGRTTDPFACRILADRTNPHLVRIFAGAFNTLRNIILDDDESKWHTSIADVDGLTRNGIFISHPQGGFYGGEATPGLWREVSVGGELYEFHPSLRGQRTSDNLEEETNILQDGTLIDIGGTTLLWRSAEGLGKSPTEEDLRILLDELNAKGPFCPVEMTLLVIRGEAAPGEKRNDYRKQQPYVYMECGHVQGLHKWDPGSSRSCPLCRLSGPVVKLSMGMEPAFYIDCSPPMFAFKPCGHMASEKTVKYWASVPYSRRTDGQVGVCPFCASPVVGTPGFVRLFFQNSQE